MVAFRGSLLMKPFCRSNAPIFFFNLPIKSPNFTTIKNPNFTTIKHSNFTIIDPRFQKFLSSSSSSSSSSSRSSRYYADICPSHLFPAVGHIARRAFPSLNQGIGDLQTIFLDSAAGSQKPYKVLNALSKCYKSSKFEGRRGTNCLSVDAIRLYELAREKVAAFINATKTREIVFTRNATEAINLVAYSWGLSNLRIGDEILLTVAEHHSAIVPWQVVATKTGAILKLVGLTEEEVPDLEQLKNHLSAKTKLVVVHHVSNTLGSVLPIHDIIVWSHDVGAKVLVDACLSVPHMVIDVQELDADFLVASSHKMCGPTGIGFLYCKSKILSTMAPFLGGGDMIANVFKDYPTSAESPARFESGTPAIAEAVGFATAIDYLSSIGMQRIHDYEKELVNYLYESIYYSIPEACIYGPTPSEAVQRVALCSFNVPNIHATDIASFLHEVHGVAICAGHHCAQPLHRSLGINASARASVHFYNTKEEIDHFAGALQETICFFTSHGKEHRSRFGPH